MPAIVTIQNTLLTEIQSHIENSKIPVFSEDYNHRWNFDNYASDFTPELPVRNIRRLPKKPVTMYNYNGFGLEVSHKGRTRGSRTIPSQLSALNFITVAHQFLLIQSETTGRFIGLNERNKVISTKKPTENSFWFEHVKTDSHRNFHTFTNRRVGSDGKLCSLAIKRSGRVVCKSSIRSKSTSFLPVRRSRK